jgi:hypothetical protein
MTAPLYGRAWNIQVLTPPDNAGTQTLLEVSSSDKETSSLRVTFEIEQLHKELWCAEVDIYNPNLQTIQTLDTGCTLRLGWVRSRGHAGRDLPRHALPADLFETGFHHCDLEVALLCGP